MIPVQLVSNLMHSWQRVPKLLFYEDPLFIPYHPFSIFAQLPTSTSISNALFFFLVSLAEWMTVSQLICYSN